MLKTPNPEVYNTTKFENTPLTKRQVSSKAYYLANKDRIVAYRKRYHIENRERILKRVRDHYHKNRDKRLAYGRKWRDANRAKMNSYNKMWKRRLKVEAFDAYGGRFCECCGETILEFLTIDHINGDGSHHRRSINSRGGYSFYHWLKNNNYPSGYRVLCMNCNFSHGAYHYCPHKTGSVFLEENYSLKVVKS